jgi:hypothetical protein
MQPDPYPHNNGYQPPQPPPPPPPPQCHQQPNQALKLEPRAAAATTAVAGGPFFDSREPHNHVSLMSYPNNSMYPNHQGYSVPPPNVSTTQDPVQVLQTQTPLQSFPRGSSLQHHPQQHHQHRSLQPTVTPSVAPQHYPHPAHMHMNGSQMPPQSGPPSRAPIYSMQPSPQMNLNMQMQMHMQMQIQMQMQNRQQQHSSIIQHASESSVPSRSTVSSLPTPTHNPPPPPPPPSSSSSSLAAAASSPVAAYPPIATNQTHLIPAQSTGAPMKSTHSAPRQHSDKNPAFLHQPNTTVGMGTSQSPTWNTPGAAFMHETLPLPSEPPISSSSRTSHIAQPQSLQPPPLSPSVLHGSTESDAVSPLFGNQLLSDHVGDSHQDQELFSVDGKGEYQNNANALVTEVSGSSSLSGSEAAANLTTGQASDSARSRSIFSSRSKSTSSPRSRSRSSSGYQNLSSDESSDQKQLSDASELDLVGQLENICGCIGANRNDTLQAAISRLKLFKRNFVELKSHIQLFYTYVSVRTGLPLALPVIAANGTLVGEVPPVSRETVHDFELQYHHHVYHMPTLSFKTVFHSLSTGWGIMTPRGEYVDVNEVYAQYMLDVDRSTFLKTVTSLFSVLSKDVYQRAMIVFTDCSKLRSFQNIQTIYTFPLMKGDVSRNMRVLNFAIPDESFQPRFLSFFMEPQSHEVVTEPAACEVCMFDPRPLEETCTLSEMSAVTVTREAPRWTADYSIDQPEDEYIHAAESAIGISLQDMLQQRAQQSQSQ